MEQADSLVLPKDRAELWSLLLTQSLITNRAKWASAPGPWTLRGLEDPILTVIVSCLVVIWLIAHLFGICNIKAQYINSNNKHMKAGPALLPVF